MIKEAKVTEGICGHCSLPIPIDVKIAVNGKSFCCQACHLVYSFLSGKGLGDYYQFKSNLADKKFIRPKFLESFNISEHEFVDDPEWQRDYLQKELSETQDSSVQCMRFYTEGMHCMACVWLLEKLPRLNNDIVDSRVNFFNKSLAIKMRDTGKFIEVLKLASQMGYILHPVKNDQELEEKRRAETKKQLYRVAVAGACAGNIMLLAISLYAGASGDWKKILEWLSFLFFLPVLFYSAVPFFKKAYYSIVKRSFSVDLAASVALTLGSTLSFYDFFRGGDTFYFDSLSMFVFLLLASRYLLERVQSKAYHFASLGANGISGMFIEKFTPSENSYRKVRVEALGVGDMISLRAGAVLPIDAKIVEGETYVNNALISGESMPVAVKAGDSIKSGARNVESSVLLQVEKKYEDSFVKQILSQIERSWVERSEIVGLTERIAFVLLILLLTLSGSVFAYFYLNNMPQEAFQRSLAILIVACPCALGIGTPLSLSSALQFLSLRGVLAKSADTLFKASKIEKVFFDKTGTLTEGSFELVSWKGELNERVLNLIHNLENKSRHPVALSLVRFVNSRIIPEKLEVADYKETKSIGVSGVVDGQQYSLEKLKEVSADNKQKTAVVLKCNGQDLLKMYFEDRIKEESKELINYFKNKKVKTSMLSGDRLSVVESYAQRLGVEEFFADLIPEQKAEIVKGSSNVMMVGDGVNDTLALRAASVGLAVNGSVGINLKSSDVVLLDNSILKVKEFHEMSKGVLSLIKRNIYLSIFYNIIGVTLSAVGLLSPLAAAIFMPVSSLTIIGSVILFFKKKQPKSDAVSLDNLSVETKGVYA